MCVFVPSFLASAHIFGAQQIGACCYTFSVQYYKYEFRCMFSVELDIHTAVGGVHTGPFSWFWKGNRSGNQRYNRVFFFSFLPLPPAVRAFF